ncbi:MAG: hypothetical protein KDA80_06320 [Planctomycetaceae bacterium]|nr:hypothetical protein [Planctomycetaceae bacterium]
MRIDRDGFPNWSSLGGVLIHILSANPVIRKRPPGIVASTSWWWRVLLLGLSLRTVVIDLRSEKVRVTSRYLWFLRFHKNYSFRYVNGITYGYSNLSTESLFRSTHDTFDRFSVGLKLVGEEEVPLFDFVGEGTFVNDGSLPDWLYWDDYAFDFSGTQESESRLFAELMSNLLDVPIVRPNL